MSFSIYFFKRLCKGFVSLFVVLVPHVGGYYYYCCSSALFVQDCINRQAVHSANLKYCYCVQHLTVVMIEQLVYIMLLYNSLNNAHIHHCPKAIINYLLLYTIFNFHSGGGRADDVQLGKMMHSCVKENFLVSTANLESKSFGEMK